MSDSSGGTGRRVSTSTSASRGVSLRVATTLANAMGSPPQQPQQHHHQAASILPIAPLSPGGPRSSSGSGSGLQQHLHQHSQLHPPSSQIGGSGLLRVDPRISLNYDAEDIPLKTHYCGARYENFALLDSSKEEGIDNSWQIRDRMKTVSVALVLCLNIGVDPPDVIRKSPCARLECWINPLSQPAQKSLESIGEALQKQYEFWQPRARYKPILDPTVEEMKKLCTSLRRNAKDERVLFHYNGHGVPKPTANGEIWVFNKNYTQYIPLSIYDLQSWMSGPSLYVFDCSSAGVILECFEQFAKQRQVEYDRHCEVNPEAANQQPATANNLLKDCIQLAACSRGETLPLDPNLPVDIFTSCLTTPIPIALRWFCLQSSEMLITQVTPAMIDAIPGKLSDRRTMLGEINWIFTAVTDTIAWNVLPRQTFHQLFRQDLLVASLFRNFLLAQRVMRQSHCNPISNPRLPVTWHHPLWQAWDLAVEECLSQLPAVLEEQNRLGPTATVPFKSSDFFTDQLTAFEVWLKMGSQDRSTPKQLPIVLQVLLSQVHRLRALELLSQFLDLGPWAVHLALSVGIFPYVLKLLQSQASELRNVLVFIWAKILAVDRTCQEDLIKDNSYQYFLDVLMNQHMGNRERTMAAFVLSVVVDGFPKGQELCMAGGAIAACLELLTVEDNHFRQWLCLCLGKIWENYDAARWYAVRDNAPERICGLLRDPCIEVRVAAVYALGTFLGNSDRSQQVLNMENNIGVMLLNVSYDSSPLVRRELTVALSSFVAAFNAKFRVIVMNLREGASSQPASVIAQSSMVHQNVWNSLMVLSCDPVPSVADSANSIVEAVEAQVDQALATKKDLGSKGGRRQSTDPTMLTRAKPEVSNIKQVSTFYAWTRDRFRNPERQALQPNFVDQSGESAYFRKWRVERNRTVRQGAQLDQLVAGNKKLNNQVLLLDNQNGIPPSQILFHPYESILISATPKGSIIVWDSDEGQRIHEVVNTSGRAPASRAVEMKFVNDQDDALLLTGSEDGVVRLWGSITNPEETKMVTAWQAMPERLYSTRNGAGQCFVVMDWLQASGHLFVGGESQFLRIWSADRELCIQDLPTNSSTPMSAISVDKMSQSLAVCGFIDGTINVYDKRAPIRECLVQTWWEDRHPIVDIHLQKAGGRELVSACANGLLRFWDVRYSQESVRNINTGHDITSFAMHDYAPVMAAGSNKQMVNVYNIAGDLISSIRHYDGFLGQRIGPVSDVAFHPYKVCLGVASTDCNISLFAGEFIGSS